jgi:histidine kinase
LYAICEGKDVGVTIYLIASQINCGKEYIQKDTDLSIAVAKLNMKAGMKAIDGCDHKTAYSYFGAALSLLPEDNWERYYDLSVELNFLMASAANSLGKNDEAELLLNKIFVMSRCFEDKLPGYFLLTQSKYLLFFTPHCIFL